MYDMIWYDIPSIYSECRRSQKGKNLVKKSDSAIHCYFKKDNERSILFFLEKIFLFLSEEMDKKYLEGEKSGEKNKKQVLVIWKYNKFNDDWRRFYVNIQSLRWDVRESKKNKKRQKWRKSK